MSRVSFYTRPYDRLEPYDGKLSRTVLRGGTGSNASLLPDIDHTKDKIGYEVPFTRLFYKFVPPTPSDEIFAEIKELEAEEAALMKELFGNA